MMVFMTALQLGFDAVQLSTELALARQNASILPKGHGYSPCGGLYAEQAHGKWRGPATEPGLCDRCKVKPGIIQYHLAGSWVVVAGRAP